MKWLMVAMFVVVVGCLPMPKGYRAVKLEHLEALRDGIHYYVKHSTPDTEKTAQVGKYICELSDNLCGERARWENLR